MTSQISFDVLTARLRDRIVSALHVGRVHPGDRLPGIREVARETGANPRTVAKAYRALEVEGLVDVRGRSGVYAAVQDHWGAELPAETGRWLGGILFEAWKRHIPIPDLAALIRRCTVGVDMRAVCIAATEDERRAICAELERSFGIHCTAFASDALPRDGGGQASLPPALREADFLVATAHVAGLVRSVAVALAKPLVVATLHPDLVGAAEGRTPKDAVAIVCVEAAFGEQVRAACRREPADRIRVVLADDAAALAALRPEQPVLLTLAARERLGETHLTPLVPLASFLSPRTASEISELMVRLHMEREHAGS